MNTQNEPAQCAVHPDKSATGTCLRCGLILCDACRPELSLCEACINRFDSNRAVNQLPIFAILLAVHGGLVVALSAVLVAFSISLFASGPTSPFGDEILNLVVLGLLGWGAVQLVPGVLQLWAGVRLFRWEGRPLALVSLWTGLLTFSLCYCFPTAVVALVWGLRSLNNPMVRERFRIQADHAKANP